MLTLGVLADTHVPDRARKLNPRIETIFAKAGVTAILHAGDICSPEILEQLGQIAPVHAVQGNRDIWRLGHLPLNMTLNFEGVQIGLSHGHNGFSGYITEKLSYLISGYQVSRYHRRLKPIFPAAKVFIFGHTHRPENTWVKGTLLFNPGPSIKLSWGTIEPSVGLLRIEGDTVAGKIIQL
jgi:putative phosphoesterase